MYPINTKLEKRFFNGKWCPGTVISGPYQFDDEMPVTARWEIAFDDGDREFLSTDELQCCHIGHRPTCVNNSTPTVETVAEDDDDDIPYSSPMDDTPLGQRPEEMFPDKDEDLPPRLREPRPYNGYMLECNDDKKTFRFSVNHKKRKSKLLLLHGMTHGGLCYMRSVVPPMPMTEGKVEMSLDTGNKAMISMVEDHPKNSHRHEMKLHALSAKAERLLWHQRLAHCGDKQLCLAHMFSDGVPEITCGKDSALDSCLVCLAANMKSRNRGDGEMRAATEPGQGLSLDFSFAGQHSKNTTNPEQMQINDYMGIHGETCYLLLYDHVTERPDGAC